ncbi:MAG: AraC family transcriptional regulator [Candidatus Paceibacterota bacterium]|jgi:AraC-like DNA-binding protein/quercetin dioxygenase-like cupin family protein
MELPARPLLERIPLHGPASLAIREFKAPAFRYPWHQHPEIELTWILKGSGLRYVGDSVEPFHAGDFCLLGSNLPHTWLTSEKVPGAVVRSLVVQFDPDRWGKKILQLPEFARIADLLDRASHGLSFEGSVTAQIRRKMFRPTSSLRRFTALLEILEELGHSNARPLSLAPWGRGRQRATDSRLDTVFAYLTENAGSPVSQADAAGLVRLSPAAFSRFFRRTVGKTFQAYLSDLRLSEACRQLLESKRTISEIAFDAGFGNLSNFNRAFRLARGMAPGEFRRQAVQEA